MPYDYPCQMPGPHPATTHCQPCQAADCDTIIKTHWGGATEPQIVYRLFFSPSAVSDWTAYMGRWHPSLLYAGVFIHQRPYCRFNPNHSPAITLTSGSSTYHCEIGDLLIIFTDKPATRRLAIFLQAKMAGGAWPPNHPKADQWELYTTWPTFRYTPRSPAGNPGPRLCTQPFQGSPDPGAQYTELDASLQTVQATPALWTASMGMWDQTIHGLLNGSVGRTFSYHQGSAANDWDRLIWDLLTHTHGCAMPASVSSGAGGTRGAGNFLSLNTMVDTTSGQGPGDQPPLGSGPDDPWGIPVLHLIRENG